MSASTGEKPNNLAISTTGTEYPQDLPMVVMYATGFPEVPTYIPPPVTVNCPYGGDLLKQLLEEMREIRKLLTPKAKPTKKVARKKK